MEVTELREQIDLELGSNKLGLSEQTFTSVLEDALEDITEDSQVDDKFKARIVKRLKTMNGQLHADVANEVKTSKAKWEEEYKKNHPSDPKPPVTDPNKPEEPEYIKSLREEIEALKAQNKANAEKLTTENIIKNVREGLLAKFKASNVESNSYILRHTLSEMEIPSVEEGETVDTAKLIDDVEKAYYKNLKEAGLGKTHTATPQWPRQAGGDGKDPFITKMFAKKKAVEGWGNKQ